MTRREEPSGARTYYRDARWYDHTNLRYRVDVEHYVRLARRAKGPVLELGVGTGRVALAIARAGVELCGVDRAPEMLARAAERLASAPRAVRQRVELREGDMRELRLGRRFPLVIAPFNAFQHLYDDQDVERAPRHLPAAPRPGRAAGVRRAPARRARARAGSRALLQVPADRAPARRPALRVRGGLRLRSREADPDRDHPLHGPRGSRARVLLAADAATVLPARARRAPALQRLRGRLARRGFAREPIDEATQSQVVIARPLRD
ncbi:MAG: class I SAM-dependent methyltransferase [Sandaracinaceae bacterium]|nr:class I SAM-dependent methyltransferase [Sandaracinaceae bacterium]